MKPTDEQIAIIEAEAPVLRVNAFAGTGKTTTLVKYAEARPHDQILYIAFNRAIRDEAQSKFPPNVKCLTSHGLAYAKFGRPYQEKLKANLKANEVSHLLDLTGKHRMMNHQAMLAGQQIIQTLGRFFSSKDETITTEHVNLPPGQNGGSLYDPQTIAKLSSVLWDRMQDTRDTDAGMLHDGYLKLFQLSKPHLNYDIILFDEAQDANPCTLDFVYRQSCQRVFVGDAHQSIYLFRGAVNAMEQIQANQTLALTGSFRFGPHVAAVANAMLHHMRHEDRRIRGLGGKDELAPVDRSRPHTVICRSNGSVFDEAVISMSLGRKVAFVGGPGGYTFDKVNDAYNLQQNNLSSIRDPYIRNFGNFAAMEAFAETADDRELKSLIRVTENYGKEIPTLVQAIKNVSCETHQADVVLTTAHKSKGLEWEQVRLTDDYIELVNKHGNMVSPADIRPDELNILYVAATRAQKRLEVNGGLAGFLKKASEEPNSIIPPGMSKMIERAAKAPQLITNSAAVKNLVKSKRETIKEYSFNGRFNAKRNPGF